MSDYTVLDDASWQNTVCLQSPPLVVVALLSLNICCCAHAEFVLKSQQKRTNRIVDEAIYFLAHPISVCGIMVTLIIDLPTSQSISPYCVTLLRHLTFTEIFTSSRTIRPGLYSAMVLLAIRAPLLSLCVTMISVICELAFLTAALTFLRYRACVRLRKSKRVNIRAQHRRVLAVTLFAMIAFVALETVTSIFSDPQSRTVVEIQPCVRNVFGVRDDQAPLLSESIHFVCTQIDSTTVVHFEGNFSNVTKDITCAPQPIYSYILGEVRKLPREDSEVNCAFRTCAFADFRNNTLLLSGLQKESDQEIAYLPTRVNPNRTAQLDLKFIASSLADSYSNSITEVGEIRRIALLGSVADQCPFTRDVGPATTIPVGVVIGASLVWASSLLFFFASLFFRRRIFFDITHPMHWARRARHDQSRAAGDDPELQMVEIDGEICITVTGYLRNRDC